MDRNDYVRPQTLIDAIPEEPTEEYVMLKEIKPLAIMRSNIYCAFTYYELYLMGYRRAMKEWCDAIDKTDAAISTTDFDGLWDQLNAAAAVAIGAVQKVEELRATNAALSDSFCEEKKALETKVARYKAAYEQLLEGIEDLEKERDELQRKLKISSQRIKFLEKERTNVRCTLDVPQSNSSSAEAKVKELKRQLDEANEKAAWIPASNPPKEHGKYLVWGEYSFTPDHNDEPNRVQRYGIAMWSPVTAWWFGEGRLERVLYWQPMPPVPNDSIITPYRVEVEEE